MCRLATPYIIYNANNRLWGVATMKQQFMDLTLENLDDIYKMLALSYKGAEVVLNSIDLNSSITPSSEKRELLNVLMDTVSGYLLEVSHVDSFLQQCDVHQGIITPDQHKNIVACQQLCRTLKDSSKKILGWVVQQKKQFNEAACPVLDVNEPNSDDVQLIDNDTHISPAMIQSYQQCRELFKEIHKDLLFVDPQNMMNSAGRQLDVQRVACF